jgi:quercetin dioxygenase-like cupin family protein
MAPPPMGCRHAHFPPHERSLEMNIKHFLIAGLFVALPLVGSARAESPPEPAGYQSVKLPSVAGKGEPIEARVVADTPHVKSVVIILRNGATLKEHSSPFAASIQALSGRGKARLGQKTETLTKTELLLLDPGVKHEVIADAGTELVLLVHHMKGRTGKDASHHGH